MMSTLDPNARPEVDPILEQIEIILLRHKLHLLGSDHEHDEIDQAFRLGMQVRRRLNTLIAEGIKNLDHLFKPLIELFNVVLAELKDNDEAIKEFVARLDVTFLHGLNDVKTIKTRLEDVLHAYAVNYQQLQIINDRCLNLKKESITIERQWLLTRLTLMNQQMLAKSANPLTLDDIQLLGHQYGKQLLLLAAELTRQGLITEPDQHRNVKP